jgi:hypothetical protein
MTAPLLPRTRTSHHCLGCSRRRGRVSSRTGTWSLVRAATAVVSSASISAGVEAASKRRPEAPNSKKSGCRSANTAAQRIRHPGSGNCNSRRTTSARSSSLQKLSSLTHSRDSAPADPAGSHPAGPSRPAPSRTLPRFARSGRGARSVARQANGSVGRVVKPVGTRGGFQTGRTSGTGARLVVRYPRASSRTPPVVPFVQ